MNHSISYTFNVSVEGTQGSRGSRGRRWIHRKSKMNNQQSIINVAGVTLYRLEDYLNRVF